MPSKFGGIPVEPSTPGVSKFGGVPVAEDQTPLPLPAQGPLEGIMTSLGNTLKGGVELATGPIRKLSSGDPMQMLEALSPGSGVGTDVIRNQFNAQKAQFDKGNPIAGSMPFVGPLAADTYEKFNSGRGWEAGTDLAQLLLIPELSRRAGPAAQTAGRVATNPAVVRAGVEAMLPFGVGRGLTRLYDTVQKVKKANAPPELPVKPPPLPALGPNTRSPIWEGAPEPQASAQPDLSPISPEYPVMPSGRVPGPLPPSLPGERTPLWKREGLQMSPMPEPPSSAGSSAVPSQVPSAASPNLIDLSQGSRPNVGSVKHAAEHTDVIRQAHALAQELELPGSPAGKGGHSILSKAAKDVYGVDSYSKLSYKQKLAIHEYMLERHTAPTSARDLLPE